MCKFIYFFTTKKNLFFSIKNRIYQRQNKEEEFIRRALFRGRDVIQPLHELNFPISLVYFSFQIYFPLFRNRVKYRMTDVW